MKNSYKKLGKNITLIAIGNFSSKVLGVLFIPFYTNILTTQEYGVADLVSTTVSLLFPIFTLVICESMMRYALDNKDNRSEILWNGNLVWILGFCLLVCLSPLLSFSKTLCQYKWTIIIYYFTYSLYFNFSYFIRGIDKVKIYTVCGILQTISVIGFNLIFLLVYNMGVEGYLYSYIISNFLSAIFLFGAGKLYLYRPKLDLHLFKDMIYFSLPMIPNQISFWVSNSSDKYIMMFFWGSSLTGIYSIAYKIPTIYNVFSGIFSSAWRISSVDGYGTDDHEKFYTNVYGMYTTFSLLAALVLMFLNKVLSKFLFAKGFYNAYVFVPFLIVAVMFGGVADFLATIYLTAKKTKMIFYSTVISAVTNTALNFILIPHFGGIGAAFATMISYFVLWIIRLIDSRKILAMSIDYKNDICSISIVLVCAICITINDDTQYILSFIGMVIILVMRHKEVKWLLCSAKIYLKNKKKEKQKND